MLSSLTFLLCLLLRHPLLVTLMDRKELKKKQNKVEHFPDEPTCSCGCHAPSKTVTRFKSHHQSPKTSSVTSDFITSSTEPGPKEEEEAA